jgi:geranylgeranyl transferase type-2 subunit alpha
MCTFDPDKAARTMAPNLGNPERIEYLRREIEAVRELLDEESDCKWIYQALIECTMLLARLEGTTSKEVKQDVAHWVSELKRLDPLRRGRWTDLETSFVA